MKLSSDDWKTSTRSGTNGQCVEVRAGGNGVQIRDSKDPGGGIVDVDTAAWAGLIELVKAHQFDV